MTRVALIATGGTIASRPGPDGVTVALDGAQVLDQVDSRPSGLDVEVVDLAQGPSWNLDLAALGRVVNAARDALARGCDGVVVTHGTDALEETAFLAHLLAGHERPVVITGAMRNAGELGRDGPRNLADALVVAVEPAARSRGALVVMNGEIHSARWATKTHTAAVDSFRSTAGMAVGIVGDGRPRFHLPPGVPPLPPPLAGPVDLAVPVAVVPSYSSVDGAVIGWHLDAGARGLVLVGGGAGNVNQALLPGIEAALDRGIPVVVASRVPTGPVTPTYGGAGGHRALARLGVIGSGDLGWVKTRLALVVALGAGVPPADYLARLI